MANTESSSIFDTWPNMLSTRQLQGIGALVVVATTAFGLTEFNEYDASRTGAIAPAAPDSYVSILEAPELAAAPPEHQITL